MSKAIALTSAQIKHVLKVCKLMQHSEGKRCALVLSHAALRVSEIARLQVKTILYPSGAIRDEIHLPAAICKGTKARTIWLSNKTSRAIIQQWIDYRIKRRWGLMLGDDKYQGLNPNSKFLFNNRGRGYAITEKKRELIDGSIKIYWASDALEHAIRGIYKKSGLHNASSHSGRKSLVTNSIIKRGRSLEQMAQILGHDDIQTTLDYVDISPTRLAAMYEAVL